MLIGAYHIADSCFSRAYLTLLVPHDFGTLVAWQWPKLDYHLLTCSRNAMIHSLPTPRHYTYRSKSIRLLPTQLSKHLFGLRHTMRSTLYEELGQLLLTAFDPLFGPKSCNIHQYVEEAWVFSSLKKRSQRLSAVVALFKLRSWALVETWGLPGQL